MIGMRTRAVLAVLGCLSATQSVHAADAGPAEQITRIEAAMNAAYAANDLARYFSYYADDFRGLFPDGPTTLAQYRKEWTAYVQGGGGVDAFTYTDIQVQVSPSGDAAVASYRATARTHDAGKPPVEEKYLETDVFFKRQGGWKLVEVHYSVAGK